MATSGFGLHNQRDTPHISAWGNDVEYDQYPEEDNGPWLDPSPEPPMDWHMPFAMHSPRPPYSDNYYEEEAESSSQVTRTTGDTSPPRARKSNRYVKNGKEIQEHVDKLISRGKLYNAHKEELRATKMRQEMKECVHKPKLSKKTKQDLGYSRAPLADRFAAQEQERRHRLEQKRRMLEENKDEYSFKPKLSRRARSMGTRNTASACKAWTQGRQERLEEMRQRKEQQELAQVQNHPKMNPRSQRIVYRKMMQHKQQHPTAPPLEFADHQIEKNRLAKMALREKLLNEEAGKNPGTPKITSFAASLQRDGDIGDRLYEMWVEKKERETEEQWALEAGLHGTHSPIITRNAQSIQRQLPIHDELLARHEYAQMRKEEVLSAMHELERDQHRPVINPVSDEIASRLPQSTEDRLFTKRKKDEPQNNYSFQPELNPKSRELASERSGGRLTHSTSMSSSASQSTAPYNSEHVENLLRQAEQSKERKQQLRAENEEKIMKECTFKPNVGRKESSIPSSVKTYEQADMYQRVVQWAKKRDSKLIEEMNKKKVKDMEECTFTPKAHKAPPQHPGNLTPRSHPHSQAASHLGSHIPQMEPDESMTSATDVLSHDGSQVPNPWGFEEFVLRHQEARERREDTQKIFATGKRWTNALTKPKPFKLGQPYAHPIKSLQKPTMPPRSVEHPHHVAHARPQAEELFEWGALEMPGANYVDGDDGGRRWSN
eukprot:TRINITY_DN60667_c0_g1_i1.p1 TRINITY_DN60667_c0_g1~~TRINITY_DN60667_c0_g1_i1.p1  ORF type:complete len:718 (+),score=66.95 TRINITY_DN60667_c0_g1_i1:47-2200(+)